MLHCYHQNATLLPSKCTRTSAQFVSVQTLIINSGGGGGGGGGLLMPRLDSKVMAVNNAVIDMLVVYIYCLRMKFVFLINCTVLLYLCIVQYA